MTTVAQSLAEVNSLAEDRSLHQYDQLFYRYQREGSLRSARRVLPLVHAELCAASVLDVGCGAGAWLCAHRELGCQDIVGVDGHYVDRSVLLFGQERFLPHDITQPIDLGRQFDLIQCLEVAEHIDPARSETLVDNLVRHGRRVLFSAAVPGQGGEDHINEQPYGYWRDLFAARGYRLFDFVRPQIVPMADVEAWYRYNTLFFAHDAEIAGLAPAVSLTRVGDRDAIQDFAPLSYRLRKLLVRQLPHRAVSRLAVWKHQRAVRKLRKGNPIL